jgi:phosphoribosylglycinamide formyltransferase 1
MATPRKQGAGTPPTDPFERARAFCLAFPESSERLSHGESAFFVKGKLFVTFSINHHHDGVEAILIKAAPGVQEMLIEEDPEIFYRPKYVGVSGWVGARTDTGRTPWEEIEALIRDAWMLAAPKRLAAAFEAGALEGDAR